ncbi:MAG TPA: hypothetical protein VGK67_04155 [Myxococcales bacterium]
MSRTFLPRLSLPCVLLLALGFAGCRDFTVPPAPQTQDVALEPAEAFGEQEIGLRFQGKVEVAKVQVSIGGKLAVLPEGQTGDGVVRAIVPRLSGTCAEDLPVLVSAPGFSFNAATLRYRGVGHPGSPRPMLSSTSKSVTFQATSAAILAGSDGSALVASGYGEAVLVLPLGAGAGPRVAAVYRPDFVLGLDSPGGGVVVDAMQHGQVEQFSLGHYVSEDIYREVAPTGGMFVTPPPDFACFLPSALSQAPSMAVLPVAAVDGTAATADAGLAADAATVVDGVYHGLLLATAPAAQAYRLEADSTGLVAKPVAEATDFMRGAGTAAVAVDGTTMALVRGGPAPSVRLVDGAGKSLAPDFALASQGDEWSVVSSGGSAGGLAVAYLQSSLGLDGRLLLVGRPGQSSAADACKVCDGSGGQLCGGAGQIGFCMDVGGRCECVFEVDCTALACGDSCLTGGTFGVCLDDGTGTGACTCVAGGAKDCGGADGESSCLVGMTCDLGGTSGTCTWDGMSCGCSAGIPDVPCDPLAVCGGACTEGGLNGTCVPDSTGPGCVCEIRAAPPDSDGGVPGADDAGTGGKGGGAGEDAGTGRDAAGELTELAVHGAALTSLAVDSANSVVYGVDGVSAWLYTFRTTTDPLGLEPTRALPLPEPGLRVAVAPGSQATAVPVVIGRSGRIYEGPDFNANRVRLGLSSVSPRLRASCESPQAVVSAAEIGATVVVPTAEGPAAFLEGAPGARFSDTVAFAPDGGLSLAYFYSGGTVPPADAGPGYDAGPEDAATGFVVSQTSAQKYALDPDGGLPKKTEFHFSARAATAIPIEADVATLVVGTPEGLRFVPMEAGALPLESVATLEASCPDVRKLVALGGDSTAVFALAHREQKADGSLDQLLCLADARTRKVDVNTVPQSISAIAAATSLESSKLVSRLYTVGWEASGAGTGQRLTVRQVEASATDPLKNLRPLPWGTRAAELLPTGGAPISALAASPDGRRLLVALAGEKPGLLAIDPLPFLQDGPEADRAAAITTIWLPATPVGIGFTDDGARAVVALSDDTLAFVE